MFSPTIQQEIANKYASGASSPKLAKKYGCCSDTIRNILISQKIKLRPNNTFYRKLHGFDSKIAQEYILGKNCQVLAKKYNVTDMTIASSVRQQGYKIRDRSHACRKYKINEKFFSKINPKSAYVLGFWMADGCMNKNNGIRFDQSAKPILIKILKTMKSTHPIKVYFRNKSELKPEYYTTITNRQMYIDLKKICLFNLKRKTYEAQYPLIPSRYNNHFIRGLFDGDGFIFRENRLNHTFGIAGTKQLLEKCQNELMKNCNLNKTKIIFYNGTCNFHYRGNKQLSRIRNWLYKDADGLYLDRKKHTFDLIGDV